MVSLCVFLAIHHKIIIISITFSVKTFSRSHNGQLNSLLAMHFLHNIIILYNKIARSKLISGYISVHVMSQEYSLQLSETYCHKTPQWCYTAVRTDLLKVLAWRWLGFAMIIICGLHFCKNVYGFMPVHWWWTSVDVDKCLCIELMHKFWNNKKCCAYFLMLATWIIIMRTRAITSTQFPTFVNAWEQLIIYMHPVYLKQLSH